MLEHMASIKQKKRELLGRGDNYEKEWLNLAVIDTHVGFHVKLTKIKRAKDFKTQLQCVLYAWPSVKSLDNIYTKQNKIIIQRFWKPNYHYNHNQQKKARGCMLQRGLPAKIRLNMIQSLTKHCLKMSRIWPKIIYIQRTREISTRVRKSNQKMLTLKQPS